MPRIAICLAAIVCFALSAYVTTTKPARIEQHPKREKGRSGALEALDFWSATRAYPNADIPSATYYRSFVEAKRKMKSTLHSSYSSYQWQFIGPVNLSGRTIALALNPITGSTLYAGSASGGLWRSLTGGIGGHWERVSTGYPVLGVNAIAIDPADTNIIYIGTGEVYRKAVSNGGTVIRTTRGSYGMGILKTTDNGETWTKCLDWSYNQQQGVQVIKINPLNHNTVWAGTTDGILKSSDGGLTWLTYGPLQVTDLILHPIDTSSVMASCGNFGTTPILLRTTDAGANWDQLIFPYYTGKTMLATCGTSPNTVYASVADSTTGVASVWRSDDFGLTWTMKSDQSVVNIMGVQGWYSHYIAVHPGNPDLIVYAGVNMVRSTNGGVSYSGTSGSYSDHHAYAIHPLNPNIRTMPCDGVYARQISAQPFRTSAVDTTRVNSTTGFRIPPPIPCFVSVRYRIISPGINIRATSRGAGARWTKSVGRQSRRATIRSCLPFTGEAEQFIVQPTGEHRSNRRVLADPVPGAHRLPCHHRVHQWCISALQKFISQPLPAPAGLLQMATQCWMGIRLYQWQLHQVMPTSFTLELRHSQQRHMYGERVTAAHRG